MDEPALIEALKTGVIAGAGLDVQETEPPLPENPLYTMDNVILTPAYGLEGTWRRQKTAGIHPGRKYRSLFSGNARKCGIMIPVSQLLTAALAA